MSLLKYRIYGFEECHWCMKAKMLASAKGLAYEYVEVPTHDERVAWMDDRGFEDRQRTFPKIYMVGKSGVESLIGGYSDLEISLDRTESRES